MRMLNVVMRKILLLLAALLFFGRAGESQIYEGRELVRASLIADVDAIVPGKKFTVGLLLKMEPDWHTYWQYPGDAGMPTRIDWDLPPGFRADAIQWPLPEKVVEPGDLWTYAYRDEVLLLVEIMPPSKVPQKTVTLKAHAHWLVCDKICVPGDAELSVPLAAAPVNKPAHEELFAKYRQQIPRVGAPFQWHWETKSGQALLTIHGAQLTDFFPLPPTRATADHPKMATAGDATVITIPFSAGAPDQLSGVAVVDENGVHTGWFIASQTSAPASDQSVNAPSAFGNTWKFLFFGFIGGVILNVMPCVLPVIALKMFGFIKQAGESHAKIFRLGLAFVAGIFVWFLALAALIVGFKSAGHELNWAFQFQHPAFLAGMAVIIFIFALNLLGVFEIVLPGTTQTHIADLSGREGYGGAFLHGVFATLMATPCTAPFLGPALGFALAQPPAIVFAMFAAIAAGMSAPYFVLAINPGWLSFLPKPGMWMVRVKQTMGVLLLGTVAWLGWVLYQQHQMRHEPFAPILEAALKKGRPVFVDFTADWCVNCKVNERLVLKSDPVQRAFRDNDVIFLQADWSTGATDITTLLKHFGRAGVPLYVLYPAHGEPIVLPEVITQQIVLDALQGAGT